MLIDLLKFQVTDSEAAFSLIKQQTVDTRGDEGCFFAHAFRAKENPSELFMLMAWENQDSVEKHFETDHDVKFREKLDEILSGPPEFFELII